MPKILAIWRSRFAWLPTRMDTGKTVWMRRFEQTEIVLCHPGPDDTQFVVTRRRLPPERMIP